MANTHPSRIFQSESATTPQVRVPADVGSDSQFPSGIDEAVIVTVDGESLVVTSTTGEDSQ